MSHRPDKVFAEWPRSVPCGADIRAAARGQIGLIDLRASHHPDVQCLRTLLAAVAGESEVRGRLGLAVGRVLKRPPASGDEAEDADLPDV